MTREETIKWLKSLKAEIGKSEHRTLWHYAGSIDMAIKALQSDAVQEAVPTVVRVTMSDGSQYYLEHEGDAIQADAVQGEWIDVENEPYCECSVCGAYIDNLDDDYAFCPRCGADMRGDTE